MISARPWNAVWVAKVAISAGIPIVDTMKPFSVPISVDAMRVIRIASHIFTPICTIKYAHRILTNVMMEPVAKSISPSRMTNVIPMEAIPSMATWRSIISRLFGFINLGFATVNATTRITNTTQIALSFNWYTTLSFIQSNPPQYSLQSQMHMP